MPTLAVHAQLELLEQHLTTSRTKGMDQAELTTLVQEAKSNYAVDAPDGDSDDHLLKELQEINQIIAQEAGHRALELEARVNKLQATMRQASNVVYAVDSPDGQVDGHLAEELQAINAIIDKSANLAAKEKLLYQQKLEALAEEMNQINAIIDFEAEHASEIQARLTKVKDAMHEAEKTYAVDSPDGEVDGHLAEEMKEIDAIIDATAVLEKGELKKKIEYQHKMEEAFKKISIFDRHF